MFCTFPRWSAFGYKKTCLTAVREFGGSSLEVVGGPALASRCKDKWSCGFKIGGHVSMASLNA